MSTNHGKAREDKPEVEGKERYRVKTLKGEDWILGKGATSVVYLADDTGCPGRIVALKVIKHSYDEVSEKPFEDKVREQAERELSHYRRVRHENIIECFGAFKDGIYTVLVLEYAAGGHLCHGIIERGKFSEKDVSNIIKQVSSAVKYLHNLEKPIYIADITLVNILLVSNKKFPGTVKLSDFSLAWTLESSDAEIKFERATPAIQSPENYSFGIGGLKSDLWCLGIVAFALLTGHFISGTNLPDESLLVRYLVEYESISEHGRAFIDNLLVKDRKNRSDAAKAYILAEEWHRYASPEETLGGSRLDQIRKWYEKRIKDLSGQRSRKIENRDTLSGSTGGSSAHAGHGPQKESNRRRPRGSLKK